MSEPGRGANWVDDSRGTLMAREFGALIEIRRVRLALSGTPEGHARHNRPDQRREPAGDTLPTANR